LIWIVDAAAIVGTNHLRRRRNDPTIDLQSLSGPAAQLDSFRNGNQVADRLNAAVRHDAAGAKPNGTKTRLVYRST
jgi:hypothetical protein